MPYDRSKYPPDWPAISLRIRARAEDRCEFDCADGTRCNAPNHELIFRDRKNLEKWRYPNGLDLGEGDETHRGVKIILTVAHLNHDVEDCSDENLKAGCQLHHLRHDVQHHKKNAAWTRRRKRQNGELFNELDPNHRTVDTSAERTSQ